MGEAVFPPCSLAWGCPALASVVSMVGYRGHRDHCSFILGPLHRSCLCPPRISVSPVLWTFYIMKSCCPSKSVSLEISSSSARSPGWEVCCSARTFTTDWGFLLYNCPLVCGLPPGLHGGANGYLLQQNLCHASQYCCRQCPCPRGGPLLTHASTGTL